MGDGTPVISRALTVGPGAYNLFVAWADVAAAKPAWQSAKGEGFPIVSSLLVNAYLRLGDAARASALVSAELVGRPAEGVWIRALAVAEGNFKLEMENDKWRRALL